MKIPKRCPLCYGTKMHTETAMVTVRWFESGKNIKEVTTSDDNRRWWCDDCHELISDFTKCPRCKKLSWFQMTRKGVCRSCEENELGMK